MEAQVSTKRFAVWAIILCGGLVVAYTFALARLDTFPSYDFFSAYQVVCSFLIVIWLVADSRQYEASLPTFDYGWFHLLLFPLFGLYHLVRTRGWLGMVVLLALLSTLLVPYFAIFIAVHVS